MRCNDCKEIFEEADKIYERQGDDFSYYPAEEFLVCPYCGSDNIEETQACLWCEEEQEDAICPDCVKKLSTDETVLRYSADEPEEIELGSIYLLHFSRSEIEEILLREIKESGKWEELKEEFIKSDYADYLEWLEEHIDEF